MQKLAINPNNTNKRGIMKVIETTVYTFDELSESAKDNARQWWLDHAGLVDWDDSTLEDAANIGLKITSHDIYTNNIEGEFIDGAFNCANKILSEHGDHCDTYITAQDYLREWHKLAEDDMSDLYVTGYDEIEGDFLQELLKDYLKILKEELEYQQSNECVDESIRINEYTFTSDGKRFG